MPTLLERMKSLRPGASNRTLRQLLEHGLVRVNGVESKRGTAPVADSATIVILSKPKPGKEPIVTIPIVFEDDHLVVVDKPPTLRTVTPRGADAEESAWSRLRKMLRMKDRDAQVFIVHRLDRAASGLLVFAKTERARKGLKDALERRDVERLYAVVVKGSLKEKQGTFRSSLIEDSDPMHRVRSVKPRDDEAVRKSARDAVTHWRILGGSREVTAVEVRLETGRKNQIRIHFAEAGHPVVGDRLYNGPHAERLLLHAWTLAFTHPVTKKPLRFVSPVPQEIVRSAPKAFAKPRV